MSVPVEVAHDFIEACDRHRPAPPIWAQVVNVVGEAGEFAEAFRRYSGHARRPGTLDEAAAELADVIISAYVLAERLGIDLDGAVSAKGDVIMSRGFGVDTSQAAA